MTKRHRLIELYAALRWAGNILVEVCGNHSAVMSPELRVVAMRITRDIQSARDLLLVQLHDEENKEKK